MNGHQNAGAPAIKQTPQAKQQQTQQQEEGALRSGRKAGAAVAAAAARPAPGSTAEQASTSAAAAAAPRAAAAGAATASTAAAAVPPLTVPQFERLPLVPIARGLQLGDVVAYRLLEIRVQGASFCPMVRGGGAYDCSVYGWENR